jgi:hypothetical protein
MFSSGSSTEVFFFNVLLRQQYGGVLFQCSPQVAVCRHSIPFLLVCHRHRSWYVAVRSMEHGRPIINHKLPRLLTLLVLQCFLTQSLARWSLCHTHDGASYCSRVQVPSSARAGVEEGSVCHQRQALQVIRCHSRFDQLLCSSLGDPRWCDQRASSWLQRYSLVCGCCSCVVAVYRDALVGSGIQPSDWL